MVINIDNWQIMQNFREPTVTIFKDGQRFKTLAAKKNLPNKELVKILRLYRDD